MSPKVQLTIGERIPGLTLAAIRKGAVVEVLDPTGKPVCDAVATNYDDAANHLTLSPVGGGTNARNLEGLDLSTLPEWMLVDANTPTEPERPLPMPGDLAICQRGHVGLVTQIAIDPESVKRGTPCNVYVGIRLSSGRVGQPWQSVRPQRIGPLADIIDAYRALEASRKPLTGDGIKW